jgi:aromatic ring-opening dioxygenase LigB subunit
VKTLEEHKTMSGLVFACIAPHGWLAHPLISGAPSVKAAKTRQSMEELGQRMAATQPDVVIVATPHGMEVDGIFSLLDTDFVRGETGHIAFVGGKDHSFTLEFDVDVFNLSRGMQS